MTHIERTTQFTPDWQPIETAPKDGTAFLAFVTWSWSNGGDGSQQDVMAWDERAGFFYSPTAPNYVQGCDTDCAVTHWMPLPEPPRGNQ